MRMFSVFLLLFLVFACASNDSADEVVGETIVDLPSPDTVGTAKLEQTLVARRSVRLFTAQGLTVSQLGQLLWAAQGITSNDGRRASPSAGAIYPMTLIAVGEEGAYTYDPEKHTLTRFSAEDLRSRLSEAAHDQSSVAKAPMVIIVTADVAKTATKYGDRATRYCDLEAGHIAQNLALQAVALGLGLVTIGAFVDGEVASILELPSDQRIEYLLPVGHPANRTEAGF